MTYAHTLAATRYTFDDLRTLLARATPFRSGDALAGLAATSAAERVAAQMALADVPLATILAEPVVPLRSRRDHPTDHRQPRRGGVRAGGLAHRG